MTGLRRRPLIEIFMRHTEPSDDGCWRWVGDRTSANYGRMRRRYRERQSPILAHRFAYTVLVGPIPTGLVIDHLCRNTLCVNPAHLEVVTQGENVRRGWERKRQRETQGAAAPMRVVAKEV